MKFAVLGVVFGGGFGVVLGWFWGVFEWFWGGCGVVVGWLWGGFGVVLGWFCGGSGGVPESFQVRSEQTCYSSMANYSELKFKNI